MKIKLSTLVFLIFGFFLFYVFFKASQNQFSKGFGDNLFLLEVIENIGNGKGPLTISGASTALALPTWTANPTDVCKQKLQLPSEPLDYFKKVHPYLILYLISPFKHIFGTKNLIALLMAFSTFGLAFFMFFKGFKGGLPLVLSLVLVHMVMSHPAWFYNNEGQAYIDRLFLPIAGILFWLILQNKGKINIWIAVLMILVGILNDRTGIQAAIFLCGYGILYGYQNRKALWLIFSGGLLFLFSIFLIFKMVKGYESTGAATSQLEMLIHTIQNLDQRALTLWTYAFILLGPWSWKNWKLTLIAAASLLPNTLISIGGAEKTGWATHYHSGYLPVIATISAFQFIEEYKNGNLKTKLFNTVSLVMATYLLMSMSRDFTTSRDVKWSWENSPFVNTYKLYKNPPDFEKMIADEIGTIIPAGAKVSTSEMLYRFVWDRSQLSFFPIGIDDADFVLLAKNDKIGNPTAAWSNLEADDQVKLHKCLWERTEKSFPRKIELKSFPLVILGR